MMGELSAAWHVIITDDINNMIQINNFHSNLTLLRAQFEIDTYMEVSTITEVSDVFDVLPGCIANF